MLPNVLDCMRRAAANSYGKMISDAGFKLNEKRTGIYMMLGSGVHEANRSMLKNKIETGSLGNVEDAIEVGINEYHTKINEAEDILYDNITINQKYGEYQLKQLTKMYYNDIAPRMEFPEGADPDSHLELYIESYIDNFLISGHVDVITKYSICDTKSGKTIRPYHSQLGGYAILFKTKTGKPPKYLLTHYLPRIHPDKIYPGTKINRYDVEFSMTEAWYLINQVMRDINNFQACWNPATFQANPQSMLCNKKYCRAYQTKFCKYHI